MSSWTPFGPSDGDDEGKKREQEQPLWSGDDPEQAYAPPEPPPLQDAPAPPPPPEPEHQRQFPERPPLKTPANATLSLVFGILGLLFCPVILSIAAIGTGLNARRQIDANPRYSGRGVAQTGIVLGAVGIAVWAVFFLIALVQWLS